ncbi:MAG: glycosyltransferase [Planctomycetes bacterium]|nr:glycosyltransferase [Planctomycetota bacterium]
MRVDRKKEALSIVHINTHDVAGGASKVAWRLAESQRVLGHDSTMLVGKKLSHSQLSFSFPVEADTLILNKCRQAGQWDYEFHGSHKLVDNKLIRSADILHFHNMHGGYFNPFSISALSQLRPTVWTLHDMHSITGHCAHSFNCEKWQSGCGDCPFLNVTYPLVVDTSAQLLQDKKLIYDHSYLQIVTPSLWLKNKVEKSVLGNHPVELIYNGIDTTTFSPCDKNESRKSFGIEADAFVIGSVAHGGALQNQWKGGYYSKAVMDILHDKLDKLVFVNIGSNQKSEDSRVINIPHISSESELAQAYSALDVFLYTPIADNCPLVVIEALACGVPVVTFNVGGVPELVRDGYNGYVLGFRDVSGLAQSLIKLAKDAGQRGEFSRNARQWATSKFEHNLVSQQYLSLYQRWLEQSRGRPGEVKLFPIEKVPKVVQSKAFLEAEEAKKAYTNLLNEPNMESTAEQNDIVESKCDVSIVLCTKNRAQLLDEMLGSLKAAAKGVSYEVIVVEGGSTDDTLDVLSRHGVTQIYDEAQCLGQGRHSWPQLYNFGFSKTRGKWGMFASDDIIFSKDCISNAVECLNRQNDKIAGGIFFFKNINESPTEEEFGCGKYFIGMGNEFRILMNYGLVRMDDFREVSGLEEGYEFYYADSDLCCKFYAAGKQLIPLPESSVVHNNVLDTLKESNEKSGEHDHALYCQRWGKLASNKYPRPGRLVWQPRLVGMFKLPEELENIDDQIQHFWQGLAYLQRNKFKDALGKFLEAFENGFNHWKVLWCVARAAYGCGQLACAQKACETVLESVPKFKKAKEFLTQISEARLSKAKAKAFPASTNRIAVPTLSVREFESRINPLTKQNHDSILQWAQNCEKNSEQFESAELFLQSDNPIVRQGYNLVNEVKSEFANKYKHLEQLRILVHVPSLTASPGGYSLFGNLVQGLEFIGVQVQVLGWNERIEEYLEQFKPTVFITSDSDSYLSRINWDVIKRYRDSNTLKIGLTASPEADTNLLEKRFEWAKDHEVGFYYNFRNLKHLEGCGEYDAFYEHGYKIFSVEFATNPLIHYPVPGIEPDLNYVFLASINLPKWQRYLAYLPEILQRYSGFLDGPGWPFIRSQAVGLNKDRYLYARAKVGLNLHLDEQIADAGEVNERTYILAACGVPQLVDAPKLLPDRFDKRGLYVAENPKEYFKLFEYILANVNEAKQRALIAQREVFAKHTWFHRAEGFVLDLVENCFSDAQKQLPKRAAFISEVRNISSETKIKTGGLIFSKDRAMQLQATIESFLANCKDSDNIQLSVLYKASNELYKRQYDKLKADYKNVKFVEETDFRKQVISLVNRYEHVLFLVDDNLFVRSFDLSEIVRHLNRNNDAMGFSLRLGRNTTYCYAHDAKQSLPIFEQAGGGVLGYDWEEGSFDFGYPLELSSSVYRSKDIMVLLSRLEFENPNMFEVSIASNADVFSQTRSKILCFEQSVTFCNPVNMVQTSYGDNRAGSDMEYSTETLAKKFDDGMRVDIEKYSDFVPNACHQEVPLYFKPDETVLAAKMGSSPEVDTAKFRIINELDAEPKFTVLMSNYNKGQFIGQAIESVLSQTFKDLELIIIDDCSSDNSLEVIRRYLSDSRIKLFEHKQRRGVIGAMRTAIKNLRSEYFGILDSDDCLTAGAVETMYGWHEKLPDTGFIYSQFAFCDGDLVPQREGFCAELEPGMTNLDEYVASHFRTFKLSDYFKTSGFDESALYMEDIDLVYKMEEVTKLKFVNECLYLYRELQGTQSHSKDKLNIAIMSRAKSKINAVRRRSEALSGSVDGQDFKKRFSEAIEDLNEKYEDVTQYFVILRQLYEKGFFNNLKLPDHVKSLAIEDVLLWFAVNVNVRFDRLFKAIGVGKVTIKEKPLISIVMVVYNGERFISEAIDSVLAQSYKNFELIIVDDGSFDGTKEIITNYCDDRIRCFYLSHKGCGSARNKAIVESKGEYVLFVDSDDFIASDYVEKIVGYAEMYPERDYFYPSEFIIVDGLGNTTGDKWKYPDVPNSRALPNFLLENGYVPIPNPGSLRRRSLFNEIGLFDELETVEDFVFLCRNALSMSYKRVGIDLKYYYRCLDSGVSRKFKARDQITANILDEIVSIYPPELLCPKIVGIADTNVKMREYYKYLAATFDKHSQGFHLVKHGEYFAKYRDKYREKISEIDKVVKVVSSGKASDLRA